MSILVGAALAALGSACIVFGVREWRRREETTREDDTFFGGGRWGYASNWVRNRGNAVSFVVIGLVLATVGILQLVRAL